MFKHWKNITIYKLSREADLTDLEDKKKMILFTPCGSQDMAKFGFVSPFGDNSEVIAMHGNGFILVEAKRETKILPPPVIQRAIQEKIEKLEQEQARKLKKTEKDSLNRPGFPGEYFICELRLPDHYFRWKHNKLFLLLPEEYGPAFP
ncbi:hypothetical protein F7F45_22915, partial [Escherichia coli]